MQFTLGELAERLGAELRGDASVVIRSAAGIKDAGDGDITFLANGKYRSFLRKTGASAVIVGPGISSGSLPALVATDPYRSFLEVLHLFRPAPDLPPSGIDPSAIVSPEASLGERVSIGPHAVVQAGAVLGDDVAVMAGAFVGARSRIGAQTRLYPNAVVREDVEIGARCLLQPGAVVGSDGFGFAATSEGHVKIPQIGRVVVEDDVEIGANSTIDRATTGATRIGRGTKIDNLVHVAHNVEIGSHSILCAQVGISGSTKIGSWVTLAGQAGLAGHIELGDGARVGAQSGVTKSIPEGETVSGYPAADHTKAKRVYASMRHLPEALRVLRELERRIAELEARLGEGSGAGAPDPVRKEAPNGVPSGGPSSGPPVGPPIGPPEVEPPGLHVQEHAEVSGRSEE